MDATNILRPKMKTDASSNNSTGFPLIKYTSAQQSIQTREKEKKLEMTTTPSTSYHLS